MNNNKSKAQKKLKTFFKEREKIANRFKSLSSFIEVATDEEQRTFFNDTYEQVFSVFLARFSECESMPKKEKKQHKENILALLKVLRSFLIYLPHLIKKRWQFAKIARVIELGLEYGNRQEVRMNSFELLLLFIDALQTSMDEQVAWFAKALNLEPFTKPHTARSSPPTPASVTTKDVKDKKSSKVKKNTPKIALSMIDQSLICPSRSETQREDTIELLDFFFDFISSNQRKEKFEFWFDLWKQNYYVVFYPQIALDMALVSGITDQRFASQCPLEIQHCLIERLTRWCDDMHISSILWFPKNGPLVMEIARQACCLPISWNYTIRLGVELMRSFLINGKAKLSEADTQHYWKQFMSNISLIFFIKSAQKDDDIEKHAELCREVLSIYCFFSYEFASKMQKDTWIALQKTLLDTTHNLLSSNSPFATSIASTMADSMFQTLYLIWIRSIVTTNELWVEFSSKVRTITIWKATVNEWKQKVIQLTYILIDHYYEKKQTSQDKEGEGSEDSGNPVSPRKGIAPPPVHRVPRDPKLAGIKWTPQSIHQMWYTLLNILGNLCDIQDANNFALAMQCTSELIELFMAEEAALDITQSPPIPIFPIFLPWILQASTVEEKRARGRLTALESLCKMFVKPFVKPPHIDLISHFYRILQLVIQSSNGNMICVIIRNASQIFSLGLPGVAVLIPDFLKEIEKMWKSGQKLPDDVQNKSILIVLSLICYPTYFVGLSLPGLSVAQMDGLISSILLTAVRSREITMSDRALCVMGLHQRALINLISDTSSNKKEEVGEMIRAIVGCTSNKEEIVAHTALDCLSIIAQDSFLKTLAQVDVNVLYYIVDNLSDNIITVLTAVKNAQGGEAYLPEGIITGHFYTLLDILLSIGANDFIEMTPQILTKVFRALEWGLLGDEGEKALGGTTNSPRDNPRTERGLGPARGTGEGKPVKRPIGKSFQTDSKTDMNTSSHQIESLLEQVKTSPVHKSEIIREAAEVFLLTMLNNFKNFPTMAGSEQLTCHPPDIGSKRSADIDDGSDMLYFIYESFYIFSLEELPDEKPGSVRLTLRDCTGKYVWEFNITYDLDGILAPSFAPVSLSSQKVLPSPTAKKEKPTDKRNPKEMPSFRTCKDLDVDPVRELLEYLNVTHTDILPGAGSSYQRVFFAQPMLPSAVYEADLEEMKESLKKQDAIEHKSMEDLLNKKDTRQPLPLFPDPPSAPPKYHYCRLLLSHLGFLNNENRKKFSFLQHNKRLYRSVRELDKINGREVVKVGLIYVAEGQEDQYSILRNEHRTRPYDDFVKGLGWTVDVATHRGFIGGLDRTNLTSGSTAPYWASPTIEVVFHDITAMPTKASEPQQIHKKRHVGNDAVHIIWTDHKKLYDPATITSQFNDVHIVIYPLSTGLYRIHIYQKDNVPAFGPVADGMVLNKQLLVPLIRATAINAGRAVRSFKKELKKPYPTRSAMIKEIYQRYREDKEFEDYMTEVFIPSRPDLEKDAPEKVKS